MQFDLTKFLTFMLEAFLVCRENMPEVTPKKALLNRRAVRRAAKRGLRKQAREQGANGRERREFIAQHIEAAISTVDEEVAKL